MGNSGKYIFGVDIGGTTVKLGFFDREGTLLDKWEIPTRTEDGGSKILPDIADSITKKKESGRRMWPALALARRGLLTTKAWYTER